MSSFAEHYLEARSKEGRLLRDEDLAARPLDPPTATPKELRSRNFSYQRLHRYLETRIQRGLGLKRILELGCGVGWLGARLSRDLDIDVVGIDLAANELFRTRVGAGKTAPRARFVAASFSAMPIRPHHFDVVIAAATAQYCPQLRQFADLALSMCAEEGELLIADTPFYRTDQLAAAKQRTIEHYQRLDCAEMTQYYHHHSLDDLGALNPTWIYSPTRLSHRVLRKVIGHGSPFPIVSIKRPREWTRREQLISKVTE